MPIELKTEIPLRAAQKRAVRKALRRMRRHKLPGARLPLFMAMGTGKTRTSCAILDEVGAKRILVVCPFSAPGVWYREIRRKLRKQLNWRVLILVEGSIKDRARRLATFSGTQADDPRTQVVVVNWDAFWRYPAEDRTVHGKRKAFRARGLRKAILDWQPDSVVLDEVHRMSGRTTKQARFAVQLGDREHVVNKLSLTGTPVNQGAQDLFPIYRFTDESVFGTNYYAFESRYVIRGGYYGHKIIGYRNVDELERIISRTSFQASKDDLNLPERTTTIVPFKLSHKTRKAYAKMEKDSLLELDGIDPFGDKRKGFALSKITLTQIMRLRQITSGFIPVEYKDGTRELIDLGSEKRDVALDLVRTALDGKESVVIFCQFSHDIARLREKLPRAGVIDGKTKFQRREYLMDRLNRKELDVLIVQIGTASESIELTGASVCIFYSYDHSLLRFSQARDRVHRPGQTNRVLEYILCADDSVEEDIVDSLVNKQDLASRITSLDYARSLFTKSKKG